MRTRKLDIAVAVGASTLIFGLVGCGSSESAPRASLTPSSTASASPTPASASATATFVVVDGKKSSGPDIITVRRGDKVTLAITSDQVGQVHLHGYDRLFEIQPGLNRVQFLADVPGTFEIELHATDSLLTRLRVQE
ncbi:MAG: hypothetical protein WBB05_29305 [Mycolicibacterium fortuitum]|uniref:hypothetical protein n=1 Tax=Mycolicibacterium fortuitum TaxID=1766 RepID=UPI0022BA51FA|nr:hypothetical protein [Mycolicibacterium fortuitum]WAY19775.1 hypothetical protein OF855_01160 [Mycolicibacterium fortuitum]